MGEAKHRLPQILDEAQARITTESVVLAQLRARQAVKRQLPGARLKVTHYSARDISVLACQYLSERRSELMPDAIETIERWTAEGVFGKRAQRAALERFAQTQKA